MGHALDQRQKLVRTLFPEKSIYWGPYGYIMGSELTRDKGSIMNKKYILY